MVIYIPHSTISNGLLTQHHGNQLLHLTLGENGNITSTSEHCMIPGWEDGTDDSGLDSAFCHHGFKVSTGFDSRGRDPHSMRVTIAANKGCGSGGCGNSDDGCGLG